MASLGNSAEVKVYLDTRTGLVTPGSGDGLFTNPTGWSNPTAVGALGTAGGDLTGTYPNPTIASTTIKLADGTVAAPSHAFSAETGSGLYRIGAGDVGLSILGVKVAEFTATSTTIVQPLTSLGVASSGAGTGSQIVFGAANAYVFAPATGAALHENTTSGLLTIANRVNGGQIELRTNVAGVDTQVALFAAAGALTIVTPPAFVASDKYLVIDASGNIHKSAVGPAS